MSCRRYMRAWALALTPFASGCGSGGNHVEASFDAGGAATSSSAPADGSVSHESNDATRPDAGTDAGSNVAVTWSSLDAGATVASSTTENVRTASGDASAIVEPTFEQLTLAEVCERVVYLDGEMVDVDLSGTLRVGEWTRVTSFGELASAGDASFGEVDGGSRKLDAGGSDAGVVLCDERFAAYSAPCAGSVLVVSAPTLVFGEGPTIGGERVGFGCWESGCETACLPETTDQVGVVRVRVSAPVNARYDAVLETVVGDVRINGVDVQGAGLVEILTAQ